MRLKVGARSSNLSKIQFEELKELVKKHGIDVTLEPVYQSTIGDKRLDVPLTQMEKTDFFTKELDEMLLKGVIDIALHSAKDLPEPLAPSIECIAITEGVDSRDCLVLRDGETLESCREGIIGTSSLRRKEAMLELFPNAELKEIRGTIERRLEQLQSKAFDGVLMAKAAIIRLNLKLNAIDLDIKTPALQGKLAVLAASRSNELKQLFAPIHREVLTV